LIDLILIQGILCLIEFQNKKRIVWESSTIARQITLELNKICSVKWMAKNVIAIGLDNGTIRIYDFDQNQSTVRVIKEFKHDVYLNIIIQLLIESNFFTVII